MNVIQNITGGGTTEKKKTVQQPKNTSSAYNAATNIVNSAKTKNTYSNLNTTKTLNVAQNKVTTNNPSSQKTVTSQPSSAYNQATKPAASFFDTYKQSLGQNNTVKPTTKTRNDFGSDNEYEDYIVSNKLFNDESAMRYVTNKAYTNKSTPKDVTNDITKRYNERLKANKYQEEQSKVIQNKIESDPTYLAKIQDYSSGKSKLEYEANKKEIERLYQNQGLAITNYGFDSQQYNDVTNKIKEFETRNKEIEAIANDYNKISELSAFDNLKNSGDEKALNEYTSYLSHYEDNIAVRGTNMVIGSLTNVAKTGANIAAFTKDKTLEIIASGISFSAENSLKNGTITTEEYDNLIAKARELESYSAVDSEIRKDIEKMSNEINYSVTQGVDNPVGKFVLSGLQSTVNFGAQLALFGSSGSLLTMSAQSASERYFELEQMVDENGNKLYTENQIMANALLTGITSYATEKIGMDELMKIATGGASNYIYGKALNYLRKAVLQQTGAEGLEEAIEGLADPIIDSVTLGVPIEYNPGELCYSVAIGAFSGALMGAGGSVMYVCNTKAQYDALASDYKELMSRSDVDAETKQKVGSAVNRALNAFEETSVLNKAVKIIDTSVNAETDPLVTLSDAITPNVQEGMSAINRSTELLNNIHQITTGLLASHGVNMDSFQFEDLSPEVRTNVMNAAENFSKISSNIKLVFDTSSDINGSLTNQNGVPVITLNPNSKNLNDVLMSNTEVHELIHTIEDTGTWQEISKLVFNDTDELNYYISKLGEDSYKGSSKSQLMKEAVAKKVSEQLLNSDSFVDHLAKYNSSFLYRLAYDVKGIAQDMGLTNGISELERKLTTALNNLDSIEIDNGVSFSLSGTIQNNVAKTIERVMNNEERKRGNTYFKVLDSVAETVWGKALNLKSGALLVDTNTIIGTQFDSFDPRREIFRPTGHTTSTKEYINPGFVEGLDILAEHPFAVIEGSRPGTCLLITKATSSNGAPIVIPVKGNVGYNNLSYYDTNFDFWNATDKELMLGATRAKPSDAISLSVYGKNNGNYYSWINNSPHKDKYGNMSYGQNVLWVENTNTNNQKILRDKVVSFMNNIVKQSNHSSYVDPSIRNQFYKLNLLKRIDSSSAENKNIFKDHREILNYNQALSSFMSNNAISEEDSKELLESIKSPKAQVYYSGDLKVGTKVSVLPPVEISDNIKTVTLPKSSIAWKGDITSGYVAKLSAGKPLSSYQTSINNAIENSSIENAKNYINTETVQNRYNESAENNMVNLTYTNGVEDPMKVKTLAYFDKQATQQKRTWDYEQNKMVRDVCTKTNLQDVPLDLDTTYKDKGDVVIDPGAKSIKSAVKKVMKNRFSQSGDTSNYTLADMKDHNRLSIQVSNVEKLPSVVGEVWKLYPKATLEVKNGIDIYTFKPDGSMKTTRKAPFWNLGYIGFHLVWEENGLNKEIQITPDFDLKMKGEELYNKWRNANLANAPQHVLDEFFKEQNYSIQLWKSLGDGKMPPVISSIVSSGARVNSLSKSMNSGFSYSTQDMESLSNLPITQAAAVANNLPVSSLNPTDKSSGLNFISNTSVDNEIVTDNGENSSDNSVRDNIAETYQENIDKYGAFKPGEAPRQDVKVPKATNYGPTSEFARNFAETPNLTDEEMMYDFAEAVNNGQFAYSALTNKGLINDANSKLERMGVDSMYKEVMNNHNLNARLISEESVLLTKLSQMKDRERVKELALKLTDEATVMGQGLQSFHILKKLSPELQLQSVEKMIERMQADINIEYGDKAVKLEIPENLKEDLLNAQTEEEIARARSAIQKELLNQQPKKLGDILNAWRYLSMLGNPRTHIRNILGNALFSPLVDIKNTIATGIENLVGSKLEHKTKAIVGFSKEDMALKQLGKEHYRTAILVNDQKYETKNFGNSKLGNLLNKLSNANSTAMDKEDFIFSSSRFAQSFASYIKSNGYTAENVPQDVLAKAVDYATLEAQKATYRDFNAGAEWLNKAEKSKSKLLRLSKQALVPFTKTPMNIIRRGVEYSPLGLMKTITADAYNLSQGKIDANTFIDNLSAGMTGTMISILGATLASIGIFRTKDDDKDRKQMFDEDNGEQDYCIDLSPFGIEGTYTIDWATPDIMPLAIGAELYDIFMKSEGIDGFEDTMDALATISAKVFDPIFDTSMLSNLQSALKSYANGGGEWVGNIVGSMVSSYILQFIPTLSGQIARAVDDTRRTTYPNTGLIDKTIKQALNKIPGLSILNEPYINRSGEEEKNTGGNFFGRLIYNMVSPGYYQNKEIDKYDEEYYRLYESTGLLDAFPSSSVTSTTYDKEQYKLTDKEYTEWNKTRWSLEKEMVNDFIDSESYQYYSDEERVETIKDIRTYAQKVAKEKLLNGRGVEYTDANYEKLKNIAENMDIKDYFNYNNFSGTKQAEKIEYLENSDLSQEEKELLYSTEGYKTSYADAYAKVFGESKTNRSTKTSKTTNKTSTKKTSIKVPTTKTTKQTAYTQGTKVNTQNVNTSDYFTYRYNFLKSAAQSASQGGTKVVCPVCGQSVIPVDGKCPVCGASL